MENKKSPLLIYREKMAEVHTPEEIKAAFDESRYAVCFNYDRGYSRAKHELFVAIWEVNPEVIITEADLCIMADAPVVWRDQLLLVDKNGTKETANTIAKFMAESGIISYEYRFANEADVKICFGSADVKKKSPIVRFKGNLLIDDNKLILTARHMTKGDREKLKNTDNHTT
ncbi:MAG: hypothetical protein IJ445_00290 [Clostridia bacterium]|nr:hypothetical protein [Clostridia bacterium]